MHLNGWILQMGLVTSFYCKLVLFAIGCCNLIPLMEKLIGPQSWTPGSLCWDYGAKTPLFLQPVYPWCSEGCFRGWECSMMIEHVDLMYY